MPERPYDASDHPAYPAVNQIIGSPSNPRAHNVVGHIMGTGIGHGADKPQAQSRKLHNAVGDSTVNVPEYWQMEYTDIRGGYGRWEGFHLLDRNYFYFRGNYPLWLGQHIPTNHHHHYTLTPDLNTCETYWGSVYRKIDDIDNLIDLHKGSRHPVVDTPWYLEFSRDGFNYVDGIGPPGPETPPNCWILYAYDWGKREHTQVYIHRSWNVDFYKERFNFFGENVFYPHWPEELAEDTFIEPIIVKPYYPS